MTQWHNLFLPTSEPVDAALKVALTDAGYTLYDPFGLIPGRAYPRTVKTFIVTGAWTRLIIAPDAAPDVEIRQVLSHTALCLSLALDGDQAVIEVYDQGQRVDTVESLIPYLREGKQKHDLLAALQRAGNTAKNESSAFDALSGEVRTMADNVNMKQAERMFNKMAGKFLKRDQQTAANAMLSGSIPQWNSTGGVRIQALVACLTLPPDWREPDFVALRDAYQLHNRRRRNPTAPLYPGDAEVMEAVADALSYTPVFAGKN